MHVGMRRSLSGDFLKSASPVLCFGFWCHPDAPLPACRWALGVLIFELCSGMPPFMHEDRLVMFRKICQGALTIPKHFSNVSWLA